MLSEEDALQIALGESLSLHASGQEERDLAEAIRLSLADQNVDGDESGRLSLQTSLTFPRLYFGWRSCSIGLR
jgi:hypothetical protein